ncbi:MAG: hypothetical protein LBH58_02680 [Tannerellaceae bacterium]|jgi:hypothetical protein|nr:hypothetical protein [Tannerellaceae bacterium]
MAVLGWGKPKAVEYGVLGANDTAPTSWNLMPEIVIGTAKLNTQDGERVEAQEEGGAVVDVRQNKSKYTFEMELFVKKGDTKPIADSDGVILTNYAIRLTPEDDETEGFIMDKTSVSCIETWSSADGKRWKYTFSGLKPKTGSILKPYLVG